MGIVNNQVFIRQVINTIRNYRMMKPGDSVLVCVSGGADSVALLTVLAELSDKLKIHKIFALHINHCLRSGAIDDENFVRNLCGQMSIPLEVQKVDVGAFAKKNKKGLEEAGRIIRHKYAKLACESFGADKIAMGHNMGDNAETVILNLCRGAGLRGMAGIPPINGLIVRPLINSSRVDILAYLKSKKQPYVVDPSNSTSDFTRNRIRNIVIPSLENNVNDNAGALIARNAELFSADEDYLEKQAAACLLECIVHSENEVALSSLKLNNLHFSIASRIIRKVLDGFGLTDISKSHIIALLELSAGQTGKKFHIAKVQAVKEYNRIVFKKANQDNKGFSYRLALDKPQFIPEISKTILVSCLNFSNCPIPHCTKLLKYDIMPESVVIRTRIKGDRICLSSKDGRKFTKKLQDFFTDIKIPASQRDIIPILTIDEKIAWLILDGGKEDVGVTSSDFRAENEFGGIYVTVWEGDYAG